MVAIALYFLVSDFPEQATWLSQAEKDFIKARLEADAGNSGHSHTFKLIDITAPLKDCT